MADKAYKLVLVGKYGVGKTRIFYELQRLVDDRLNGAGAGAIDTISTGTGVGERVHQEKWLVHTTIRGSRVTVREAGAQFSLPLHRNGTFNSCLSCCAATVYNNTIRPISCRKDIIAYNHACNPYNYTLEKKKYTYCMIARNYHAE